MALIKCYDCENPCSQDIEACMRCGYKYPTLGYQERIDKIVKVARDKKEKKLHIVFYVIVLITLITWIFGGTAKLVLLLPFSIGGWILISVLSGIENIFLPVTLGLVSFKDFIIEKLLLMVCIIILAVIFIWLMSYKQVRSFIDSFTGYITGLIEFIINILR